jgi:DNA repair protein RecO (recombination protein O)
MIALSAERLYCGFYLNELVLRLIDREDPHEALFVFYQQALVDLLSEPMDRVLRRFELRLLEELGYALDLRVDRLGEPIDPDRDYLYRVETGLLPVPRLEACLAPRELLRQAWQRESQEVSRSGVRETSPELRISGTTLARLAADEPLQASDLLAARALMRAALAPHLGPKPLRSRELFRRRRH